ncbi:MAG: TonB-dependent receptor, partial [Actinomycetota bacterium]
MVSYDPLAIIENGTMVKRRNSNWDVRIKSWEVEEKVTTGYVKFDVETEMGSRPLTGNFGVQVVQTDQGSTGDAALNDYGVVRGTLVSGGTKYTEVLPSL